MKASYLNILRVSLLLALIGLTAQFSPAQWVQQGSFVTATLTDVATLDSSKALAVGRNNVILRTTNSGVTWTYIATPLDVIVNWNSVSFQDTLNGIIVGEYIVATTSNGGTLWRFHSVPGGRRCFTSLYLSPSNFYVGQDSGWVSHTLDSGNTWTSEKISQWPIRSLFAWTGVYVLGLPIFALTPYSLCESRIYPSGSWQESILKNFEGLGSEAFRGTICYGGGPSFIVGVLGDLRAAPAIIRKKMSDTVWTGVSQGIVHDGAFWGISAPSTNIIYVCGDGGMLFKSTNGGDSWNSFTGLTSRSLKAVSFFGVNNGFAVGDSGKILHTNNGGGVVVDVGKESGVAPKEFLLGQNYPNPFNPTTNFRFTIAGLRFVSLKIYDILGREVAILVNEEKPAGSYSVQWDATNFPSGVYFYRVTAKGFSETKKLLLIH
jgi:photosystem II stability/assembly factor-like uncharacterized protein